MDKPEKKKAKKIIETVTKIKTILPQYMDDKMSDYKEKSNIKTDWLNKKMR